MIFRRVFTRLARPFEWIVGPTSRVAITVVNSAAENGRAAAQEETSIKLSTRRSLRAFLISIHIGGSARLRIEHVLAMVVEKKHSSAPENTPVEATVRPGGVVDSCWRAAVSRESINQDLVNVDLLQSRRFKALPTASLDADA